MEIQSITKFARISPKKAREVTRVIQGLPAELALQKLSFVPRKAARLVGKTLKSAIANAENNKNLPSDKLIISKAVIEEGPVLKRWNAASKGQGMPIRKRMSHIRIILITT